jgi:hypothetical protein
MVEKPNKSQSPIRGFPVQVDWVTPYNSRSWILQYISGPVAKASIHPVLLGLNSSCYWTRNPETVDWQPGDVFQNFSVLQLFHLHPVPKNQGIGGKRQAVSIVVSSQTNNYHNSLQITEGGVRINYEASEKGKKLLLMALEAKSLVRVFLHERAAKRDHFPGPTNGYLFLGYFTILCKKENIFVFQEEPIKDFKD